MDLNRDCDYLPYVLGRLFSVLENIQEASVEGSLNSTIRDRYYNAACATPNNAFSALLKLKDAHIKKIKRDKPGLAKMFEGQLTDIMGKIHESFPKILDTEAQCAFHLGYYHERQSRYEKKEEN